MRGRLSTCCTYGLVLIVAACGKGDDRGPKGYGAARAADARSVAGAISLAPEPLAIDGQPLDGTIRPRVRAGAITGEDDRTRAAFAITGPGTGWRFAWDDLSVLAVPDRTWMARRCDGRDVDPNAADLTAALVAAAAGPFVDHDRCVPVLPPGEDFPRPLAALGAGDERAIILIRETMDPGNQTLYDIAASTDAGKSWTLRPGPPDVRSHSVADVHADRVAGTVDVLLRAHKESGPVMLLLQVDGAHPLDVPEPVEVAQFALEGACRRAGVTWWLGDDRLVHRAQHSTITVVPGEPLADPGELEGAGVIDCTTDQALVVAKQGMLHCKAAGCTPAFAESDGVGAILGDGSAVRVAADGNVLRLWREGESAPTTFSLSGPMHLHGVVVWGDTPYAVLADGPDGPPQLAPLSKPR
jgi:hypothetical protein